jgi:hypothetical protein
MKRVAALSLCMLAAMVALANATPVTVTTGSGGIGLTGVLDKSQEATNGGYDIVDLYITSLPSGEAGLQFVQGYFTAVGGTFFVANKAATASSFQSATTDAGLDAAVPPGYSAVNFGTDVAAAVWGRDGAITHNSSTIMGAWDDGGSTADLLVAGTNRTTTGGATNADGWANNLLGEFVVTKGTTNITFASNPTYDDGFGYYPTADVPSTSFNAVLPSPEPSTIALLGCGLFGLLAYAWRKRK